MTTLDQLRSQFASPCPTLAQVMALYFPHIESEKHMLTEIREGRINLRLSKHHSTRKAPHIVYLTDLAAFIDRNDPSNKPAADQAA
ncbi:pyocin activator PrtN family protein [Pseudomonas sp. RL_15y_Pfl2_60]|uniref:pyocin activator PrtN family protein n=1 Tax=Pseudomonas sp. RL_15y_Pfl2_60 TaxID=3088709 RepID=UPI0030DD77D4